MGHPVFVRSVNVHSISRAGPEKNLNIKWRKNSKVLGLLSIIYEKLIEFHGRKRHDFYEISQCGS